MLIERSLARELLIKHELCRILRIKMEFVDQTTGLGAGGRNHRVQLGSELLFVTWRRLKVNVKDDRSVRH